MSILYATMSARAAIRSALSLLSASRQARRRLGSPVPTRLLATALLLCSAHPVFAAIFPMQLHVTDNYLASSSSATVGIAVPYTLSVHADNLPLGNLTSVEFKLIAPPEMFYATYGVPNGGIAIVDGTEFYISFPTPIGEGQKVLELTFLVVSPPGNDRLIELVPPTINPSIPGKIAFMDSAFLPKPVGYASPFLVNPVSEPIPPFNPVPPTLDSVNAPDVTNPDKGATSYPFTLTFSDAAGDIVVSSIDTEPTGTDGTPRTATYTVTPPGGSWDASDNGTYTINFLDNEVQSTTTFNVFGVPAAATFTVDISSLVLHWPLEEGGGTNTAETVSGETNVAQLVNGPAWTTGLAPGSSHALSFPTPLAQSHVDAGTLETDGDYVPAASATDHQSLSSWTVTAWLNVPEGAFSGADRGIVSSDWIYPSPWMFYVRSSAGLTNNLGFDFGPVRTDSGLEVPAGRPVLVSIASDPSGTAFTGTNTYRFAIWDGFTWQTTEGLQNASIRLQGLEIGSFNTGDRQFVGSIDEVCIYDEALDLNQLAELLPAPSSWELWRQARGLTFGVNDGFNDDPNSDGRPNREHFAFDTDPLGNGGDEGKTLIAIVPFDGPDHFTYTFPVRKGAVFSGSGPMTASIDGITYVLIGEGNLSTGLGDLGLSEISPALDTGLPALGDYDGVLGPDYKYRTFRLSDPIIVRPQAFIRIQVQRHRH